MNMTPEEPFSEEALRHTTTDTAGRRGTDDRREPVDPAANPAPRSPEPDQEAIEKGEETLDRVKPY